jgi:hypothetical protein
MAVEPGVFEMRVGAARELDKRCGDAGDELCIGLRTKIDSKCCTIMVTRSLAVRPPYRTTIR